MLDGPLLFEEDSITKYNIFFSLVTTTTISKSSCKISRECFKFLKTLRSIPETGPKILDNAPSRGKLALKFILAH